jgi:RNA polymerase sigma-70 factor (ECF subfamily)
MEVAGMGGAVQVASPILAAASPIDFGELLDTEQAELLRLAQRLVWDREEARDLVQATFADAYEKRRQLRDRAAARAWLRRILVHRAMTVLRRKRLWSRLRGLFLDDEVDRAGSPEQALEVSRARATLLRALRGLPAQQATAFTLRYLTGLSLDEVASAMSIGKGTVRIHLYRALCKLRSAGALQEDPS